MARPSKSVDVLRAEKKSHRTKAELAAREKAESAFATGMTLRERPEVKANEAAHKEFLRITKLLSVAGKNDALFEPIINRYCMLQSECLSFEVMREGFLQDLEQLRNNDEVNSDRRCELAVKMQQSILNVDKQLQAKRKMALDIEKECAMTISAAMRVIPKSPESSANPLAGILNDDA